MTPGAASPRGFFMRGGAPTTQGHRRTVIADGTALGPTPESDSDSSLASGSPVPRRRTFAPALRGLRSLGACCAAPSMASLASYAGSRSTGDPSMSLQWLGGSESALTAAPVVNEKNRPSARGGRPVRSSNGSDLARIMPRRRRHTCRAGCRRCRQGSAPPRRATTAALPSRRRRTRWRGCGPGSPKCSSPGC